MSRAWEDLIAEGRELKVMEDRVDAEAGNIRWMWGDLALEVAPMGPHGENNGSTVALKCFADELDISFSSLREYRRVADAWPDAMRVASQPWAVHMQIAGREDREELIANPIDKATGEKLERWTFRAMQRFLGQKESPSYIPPPSSVEEKAAVVEELLADPEVRDAVEEAARERAADKFGPGQPLPERTFDERCAGWVHQANSLMMQGAKLAREADENVVVPGGHTALMLTIYQRLAERHLDAEIRSFLETVGN